MNHTGIIKVYPILRMPNIIRAVEEAEVPVEKEPTPGAIATRAQTNPIVFESSRMPSATPSM